MAVPFLNNIDLNKYELQNFKIFNIAGDPTAGTLVAGDAGYTWLNTSTNKIRWWDGTATRDFLDTSSSISGSQISGNISGASGSCLGNAATVTNGVYTTGSYADPTWITSLAGSKISGNISGNAATATTSTNLAGGTVGQIPYQSGAGATTFLSAGTSGQLLTSGGAASPTWTTKSDIKLSDLGSPSADLDINGWKITNVGDPTSAQDAATKAYVDAKAQGLDIKESCIAATTDVLPSYVATGTSGNAGAYLEASANGDFPTIFSFVGTPVVGNRVLVKNETSTLAKWNGIYTITALGGIASKWKITRAADFDAGTATPGSFVFVEEGTTYKGTGWVMNQTGTITINSTAITWTQFSGAGTYSANRGLVLNTTTNSFNFAQDSNYTPGQIPYASSGTAIGFKDVSGSGNVVLATAPTVTGLITDTINVGSGTLVANLSGFTGKVGIGTATPGKTLDVVGTLKASGISTLYGFEIADNYIAGPSAGTYLNWVSSDSGNTVNTPFYICGGRNNVRLSISSTGVFTWSNVVNAGTAMVLDGTGLGIGGTPVSRLSLGDDTNTDGANKLTIYRGGTSGQYTVIENGGGTIYRSYGTGGHTWYITNGTTEAARIDVNGNVGIGVSPSAWNSVFKAIQIGTSTVTSSFVAQTNSPVARIMTNSYYDSSNNFTKVKNDTAGMYALQGNVHEWYCAASGTGTITDFASAKMTLDASGNLGVGVTPKAWTAGNAIEVGGLGNALWSNNSTYFQILQNAYYSGLSATGWKYAAAASTKSGRIEIGDGSFVFYNSTAGTAGNDLTWSTLATLNSTGLGIGGGPGYRLDIQNAAGDCQAQIKSGNANASLLFDYVNNYGNLVIRKSGSDKWLFGVIADSSSAPSFKIQSSSGVALTIASTGAATFASTVTAKSTGTGTGQVGVKWTSVLAASGTGSTVTLTHNLGSSDLVATLRQISTKKVVYADITFNDDNNVNITFASSQTLSDFQITLIG